MAHDMTAGHGLESGRLPILAPHVRRVGRLKWRHGLWYFIDVRTACADSFGEKACLDLVWDEIAQLFFGGVFWRLKLWTTLIEPVGLGFMSVLMLSSYTTGQKFESFWRLLKRLFWKKDFTAHQSCIYLNKHTMKTVILWTIFLHLKLFIIVSKKTSYKIQFTLVLETCNHSGIILICCHVLAEVTITVENSCVSSFLFCETLIYYN